MPCLSRLTEGEMKPPLLAASLFAALAVAAASSAPAAPDVIVSIKPLHSLVAGVMQGVARPRLLIEGAASPHTYGLRPSRARALSRADAVFWTGPDLETFLAKPLGALAGGARIVTLSTIEGVAFAGADPHIWLDPVNGKHIVRTTAAVLAEIDPANGESYVRNAEALSARLDRLDARLRGLLEPLRKTPYFVLHDAFSHLARRYGLENAGALSPAPGRPPGARRIAAMRRRIAEAGATCLFHEPGAAPGLVATLIEGTAARSAVLDPLGARVAPGPDAYFTMMRGLARSFAGCLAPGRRSG